uniref:ATP_transf domain-containing protein n=1 Tax=Angiostrongylus cantonensis TaxID=6313 RepID=A0A0K0D4A7_ANGCA
MYAKGTGCRLGFLAYTDAVRNMRMAQILQVSAVSSNIVDGENRRVEMVQMAAGPTIEYVHRHCTVYRSSFPLIPLTLFHQVVFVQHPLLTRLRCLTEFHFQHANAMLYPLSCDNITKIVASESNQFTLVEMPVAMREVLTVMFLQNELVCFSAYERMSCDQASGA